ncbi:MAG: hypothetical protein IPK60_25745 [Sandaracinaceae bacterium]|nr:hypothetical protein [Sandaracinaceae bacterium]
MRWTLAPRFGRRRGWIVADAYVADAYVADAYVADGDVADAYVADKWGAAPEIHFGFNAKGLWIRSSRPPTLKPCSIALRRQRAARW